MIIKMNCKLHSPNIFLLPVLAWLRIKKCPVIFIIYFSSFQNLLIYHLDWTVMFIAARVSLTSELFWNSYFARKAIRKCEVQFLLLNLFLNLFTSKNSCWQSSCPLRCKMHSVGSLLMHDLRSVLFTVTEFLYQDKKEICGHHLRQRFYELMIIKQVPK